MQCHSVLCCLQALYSSQDRLAEPQRTRLLTNKNPEMNYLHYFTRKKTPVIINCPSCELWRWGGRPAGRPLLVASRDLRPINDRRTIINQVFCSRESLVAALYGWYRMASMLEADRVGKHQRLLPLLPDACWSIWWMDKNWNKGDRPPGIQDDRHSCWRYK